MNLPEFLLARIAEDEHIAEHTGGSKKRWTKEPYPDRDAIGFRMRFPGPSHIRDWSHTPGPGSGYFAVTEHCENFDPARVLAECEAKRRVVEFARFLPSLYCRGVLEPMAAVYADHPDYQEEWKP
jgi:hypothetical protein